MKHLLYAFVVASVGVCLPAAVTEADEERRTRIEIAVDDAASGENTFVFDSQDAGFDLQSMVVGESRSITDREGRTADVRRTANGFTIDFAGRSVDLPDIRESQDMDGEREIVVSVDGPDAEAVTVKNAKRVEIIKTKRSDGVTILSSNEIDAATRQRIAEVLAAAGNEGEIVYIDGTGIEGEAQHAHGQHEIRIVRKEVDVTN